MCCALPPFEPPDGVHRRCPALAVVGGARPRGDWRSLAIARLQGFSSCSPAAFPHQWSVWWGEASRAATSAPPSASRICRCALGRPLFAGAVLVGGWPLSSVLRWWQPEEVVSADEIVSATRGRTSDSSASTACPRLSCGDGGEGLFTAASVLMSSLLLFSRPRWRSLSLLLQRSPASRLEFVIPRAPWCGGCSYPWDWNRSPVCIGNILGFCLSKM
jgi:hypothetical protein